LESFVGFKPELPNDGLDLLIAVVPNEKPPTPNAELDVDPSPPDFGFVLELSARNGLPPKPATDDPNPPNVGFASELSPPES
jgi:hypothetical protein